METWYRVAVLSVGGVLGVNARFWLGVAISRWTARSSPGQRSRSMSPARLRSGSARRSWHAGFRILTPGCSSSSGSSGVTRHSRPIPWNRWHSGNGASAVFAWPTCSEASSRVLWRSSSALRSVEVWGSLTQAQSLPAAARAQRVLRYFRCAHNLRPPTLADDRHPHARPPADRRRARGFLMTPGEIYLLRIYVGE